MVNGMVNGMRFILYIQPLILNHTIHTKEILKSINILDHSTIKIS